MVELPVEIWRKILALATRSSSTRDLCETRYTPFSNQIPADHIDCLDATLATKRQAVLVCKLWAAIGAEFLYEDIRIRHGASKLVRKLVEHGGYVRRLQLPTTTLKLNHYPGNPVRFLDILRLCPHLQEIVKQSTRETWWPHLGTPLCKFWTVFAETSDMPAAPIVLDCLVRVEWSHNAMNTSESPPSKLFSALFNLPGISPSQLFLQNRDIIDMRGYPADWLSSLTTARLEESFMYTPGVEMDTPLPLPYLKHAVFPLYISKDIISRLGSQLLSIEIHHLGDYSLVWDILRPCPNLETLSFMFPEYPMFTFDGGGPDVFPALKRVHLGFPHGSIGWDRRKIVDHLSGYLKPELFPNFKQVILDGYWEWLYNTEYTVNNAGPLHDVLEALLGLGISVELTDGTLGRNESYIAPAMEAVHIGIVDPVCTGAPSLFDCAHIPQCGFDIL